MEKTKGFRLPEAGYFHPVKTPRDYVELAPATTEGRNVFSTIEEESRECSVGCRLSDIVESVSPGIILTDS